MADLVGGVVLTFGPTLHSCIDFHHKLVGRKRRGQAKFARHSGMRYGGCQRQFSQGLIKGMVDNIVEATQYRAYAKLEVESDAMTRFKQVMMDAAGTMLESIAHATLRVTPAGRVDANESGH